MTAPKQQALGLDALAEEHGVRSGGEIRRLRLFDAATERQRQREALATRPVTAAERGWTREGLYPFQPRP